MSANARDGTRPGEVVAADQGARRWAIRQVGGVRFGITGLVSRDIIPGDGGHAAAVAPAVTLLDPVQAMREVVPQLRAAGAQVMLVLSHLFFEEMERVAREVDGVDVMVGSHHGPPSGFLTEPQVVEGTILSVAGDNMTGLGQLDLTIRGGRIIGHRFHRHTSTATGPTAPAVKAVLDRYLAAR